MTDLYRDPVTNDLALTGTNQVRLTESVEEETMQRLKSRLRRWAGEWFADRTLGIPYRRDILKKNPDMQVVRSVLRSEIEDDRGVEVVTRLDVEVDTITRHMTAHFEALLITGTAVEADIPLTVLASDEDFVLELDNGDKVV